MTFAPSHKHTESVSSMLAREYIPSDTSKSVISACIRKRAKLVTLSLINPLILDRNLKVISLKLKIFFSSEIDVPYICDELP